MLHISGRIPIQRNLFPSCVQRLGRSQTQPALIRPKRVRISFVEIGTLRSSKMAMENAVQNGGQQHLIAGKIICKSSGLFQRPFPAENKRLMGFHGDVMRFCQYFNFFLADELYHGRNTLVLKLHRCFGMFFFGVATNDRSAPFDLTV